MISAYLFINLSNDRDDSDILDSLRRIPEVVEASRVYGTYDLIILIESEDTKQLKEITLHAVRKVKHVHSTMTLLSLSSYVKS